ncbi:hypothetical protein [Luteibacter sp. 329MFSha]|uniref:hypothetical protein n=1 Tax=Luteibacter sp. 329MFSha TaxID=1798239 RepID=UPI000B7FBEE5|nr:hypothetical protein [Luteibacter sp. 329MFSha]
MNIAGLAELAFRPRRYHQHTELDDWIDLAFFAVGAVVLIGMLVGGIAAVRARRRSQGIDGALARARARYGIRDR